MFIRYIIIIIALYTVPTVYSQEYIPRTLQVDTFHLKIIFAGDMMGHIPLVTSCLDEDGKYNYCPIFENVKSYISSADIAIANLEVTLAGLPYSGYPRFSSPDELADGLQKTGFNLLVTANNHALDRGKQGFNRTISILDSLHFYHTGTFKDSTDKLLHHPLVIEKNNIKLAILNYTYGTNGLKIQSPDIINYIDSAFIRADIETCHRLNADFIIVIFHWGIEYERYPNLDQRKLAEFIRVLGADAVIGSHPHVVQPIERFTDIHNPGGYFPVVFSLGNFVSNQRERYKDGGILFEMDLAKFDHTIIRSCSYLPVWVYRGNVKGKIAYRLIPLQKLNELSEKYQLSDSDKMQANQFFEDTKEHLNNIGITDITQISQ